MRIYGYFSESDEPTLRLDLISKSIEVLIDTGFGGTLVVPRNLSDDLVLQFEGFEEFYTVTGQVFVAPTYSVEANWFGQPIRIAVAISSDVKEGLLGAQMLKHCRLTIDYRNCTLMIDQD